MPYLYKKRGNLKPVLSPCDLSSSYSIRLYFFNEMMMRKNLFSLVMMLAAALLVAQPAFAGGGGGGGGHGKAKAEKKDGGEKEKKKGGSLLSVLQGPESSYYIKLDPMIMPILGENDVQEIVSMIVALQVSEEKNIQQITKLVPKIKHAYISALYGNLNKAAYRNGKFLDIDKVKNRLVAVTESFADKKVIQDVLIQGVSQRRFN